jgi:CubicO group peptidase (beta-lactamase class C family)
MKNTYPMHLADSIEPIIARAREQHIFPGAVVLVAQGGRIVHHAAYGTTRYEDPGTQPVTIATPYDLASLTKMFTTTAILRLFDMGKLHISNPIAVYLPTFCCPTVTIRHLLTHTSGLSLQLSTLRHLTPQELREAIYRSKPTYPPGTRVAYVNINSLLLGEVIAHVTGKSLDVAMHELIFAPLGMHHTTYNPPASWHPTIPPTEDDRTWRNQLVQGVVHDESTYALGGVAGHAGVFSTAYDVWRFMQLWLDEGIAAASDGDERKQLLRQTTVAMATQKQTEGLALPTEGLAFHCGMGWMKDHPIIMAHAPPDTYGHTGFTGPTMVGVPSRNLCLVVLSNRTYPQRTPAAHHETTAALLQAALA